MAEVLRCPSCGADIATALTTRLTEQIRGQVAGEAEARQRALAARETALKEREKEAAQKEQDVARLVAEQVAVQSKLASEKAQQAARAAVALERESERGELAAARKECEDAKRVELGVRQERAALKQQQADLELTIVRRLDAERAQVRTDALKSADEAHALRMREAQEQMDGLRRTIEDLKRKAEQGSQQLQGEVQETSLEDLLRREFPMDLIEPVPKGVRGADVIQRVRGAGGASCGVILWESKRTKAWDASWLSKLRDNQRDMKADVAILVSQVLPKNAASGASIDGVWVMTYGGALLVAHALRRGLVDLGAERCAQDGRGDKMVLLYGYLSGQAFRTRIEELLGPLRALQDNLQKERDAMERIWARRGIEIQRALRALSGMRGDIEGIAQGALPGLPVLDLPGLDPGVPPAG